jgi:hypothetical protein
MENRQVTVADLQRLHLHHLRYGATGIAADVETLADLRSMSTADVVDEIELAASEADTEVGGWAGFVVLYVRAAIEAGALDITR